MLVVDHLNFKVVPLLLKYINMNTADLFYKSFCILKIKVALISCRWSKVRSKAGENNGLIRPPAESVPGLDNREIAPISSPHGIGVEHQTTLASPFGSELVEVIWLTPCSVYGYPGQGWFVRNLGWGRFFFILPWVWLGTLQDCNHT